MNKISITYLGKFNTEEHTIEKDVRDELIKMGHKVSSIDDKDFDPKQVIELANKSDLFLFRTGGVVTDNVGDFHITLNRLQYTLQEINTKKVFWFFDKVIGLGNNWMFNVEPLIDVGFLNDETFLRRHHTDKLYPLHLGVFSGSVYNGNHNKDFAYDVAFNGPIYGTRKVFIDVMRETFGNNFGVFNVQDDKQFADLCASAKIIVSPRFPYDDWFWSERFYKTIGHGGFLVFPRLEGLKDEGFEDGVNYVGYDVYGEMIETIKWWLDPANEKAKEGMEIIPKRGMEMVRLNHTYDRKLQFLLDITFKRYEGKGITKRNQLQR